MTTTSSTGVTTATAGASGPIAQVQDKEPRDIPHQRPQEVSALYQPDPEDPVSFLEAALIELNRRNEMPYKDQPAMREECIAATVKHLLGYMMAEEGIKNETELEQAYHKRIDERQKRAEEINAKSRKQEEEVRKAEPKLVETKKEETKTGHTANHTTHRKTA